jgi:hypothetical protein
VGRTSTVSRSSRLVLSASERSPRRRARRRSRVRRGRSRRAPVVPVGIATARGPSSAPPTTYRRR